jgi:hypothetical protein
MNNLLPSEYVIQKFYEYAGYPKFKRVSNTYNGCCPTCREGKSWGKKRRLFYIPKKDIIACHNCPKNWSPVNWIMEQSGRSFKEIMEESKKYNFSISELQDESFTRPETSDLPEDAINLFDEQQMNYYIDNKVVRDMLLLIKDRRLDTAINRPKALYVSLKDFIHKNRLVIPYYDYNGKILWYQSRAIYAKDQKEFPKYISKVNGDRTVFGLDKINAQLDHLFIFEGPIDSMFTKNGIAMGGISMSDLQESQMRRYKLYKKIWILDNQIKSNDEVRSQMTRLLENGERVFIWPEKYAGIKDINELCCKVRRDSIKSEFFIENSYVGSAGLARMVDFMR